MLEGGKFLLEGGKFLLEGGKFLLEEMKNSWKVPGEKEVLEKFLLRKYC